MCPNSCATTQAKSSTMNSTPSSAAACPPSRQCVPAIQTRNSKNVTWTRTTVPAILAMGMDQSMGVLAGVGAFAGGAPASAWGQRRLDVGVASLPRDGASQHFRTLRSTTAAQPIVSPGQPYVAKGITPDPFDRAGARDFRHAPEPP